MNKLLTIVIPFYKESEMNLFPLLSTINTQKGLDLSQVEVLMINDGYEGCNIAEEFLSIFDKLNIRVIKCEENKGPGVARQVGLDNAVGKYIMFCDCDDLLHNVGIVAAMLAEMQNCQCEFLSTPWLEETKDDNEQMIFVPHEMEQTWLHGKMFLKEFLVSNNIRFRDDLRVHEDTYFLKLVSALVENRRHLNVTSYVWTYSPNSITRINNASYSFDSMGVFVDAASHAIKELERRGLSPEDHVIQLVIYIYLITQSKMWRQEEAKVFLDEMVNSLKVNLKDYLHILEDEKNTELVNQFYSMEYSKVNVRDIPMVHLVDFVKELRNS